MANQKFAIRPTRPKSRCCRLSAEIHDGEKAIAHEAIISLDKFTRGACSKKKKLWDFN